MGNKGAMNMRIIHRYLGFFLAGVMAVYAISGIVLIFRDKDTFKKEVKIEKILEANLSPQQLGKAIKIKNLKVLSTEGSVMTFKNGEYNSANGEVSYTKLKLPFLLDKMTHLHKAKSSEPLFFVNIFFGLSLLFFVISAFWMFLPSSSIFRKGLYFTAAGIVLMLLLLFM